MGKKSQVGIEYLIIFGFLTFVLIITIGIAYFYSESIKDRLLITQVSNFANKIVATSETVFYYGTPSKATIRVYLPEKVQSIEMTDEGLIVSTQLNSGISKTLYSSAVPLQGNLNVTPGVHYVVITAQEDKILLSNA